MSNATSRRPDEQVSTWAGGLSVFAASMILTGNVLARGVGIFIVSLSALASANLGDR